MAATTGPKVRKILMFCRFEGGSARIQSSRNEVGFLVFTSELAPPMAKRHPEQGCRIRAADGMPSSKRARKT
jgi:hypothetical protein